MMENLLCNEVWLMSPNNNVLTYSSSNNNVGEIKEERLFPTAEESLHISLSKEAKHMPELGYLKFLQMNNTIRNARFKAVDWLVKAHKRMNLLPGTVFLAVNYVDRFISLTQCRDWKCWMFELLSVACLSIASKFNETATWLLQEFQVLGADNCFAPVLIQRMELTVLKALGWRMDSITPFSYVHISTYSIAENETAVEDFTKRVTELLLAALLDVEFVEFGQFVVALSSVRCGQFVVALSSVRCVFEDLFPSSNECLIEHLDKLIPQDQKDDLVRCRRAMGKLLVQESGRNCCDGPSSPVTVLKMGWPSFCGCLRSGRKRKRDEHACE